MKPIRYLLVEDQAPDQFYTEVLIRNDQPKATVEVAADGRQALDALMRASDLAPVGAVPAPDVILLDINMPRMNGFEFLLAVKSDDLLKVIPVVILTTSNQNSDVLESYRLGAAGYIVKSADYQEFVEMINVLNRYWSVCCLPSSQPCFDHV